MDATFITPQEWEHDYLWEEQPVLTCRCSLPQFPGKSRAERRMERHWRHVEQVLRRWLETYHARCCVLAEEALEASKPLPSYSVSVSYEVIFQDDRHLSLLWRVETKGMRTQKAELWDFRTGTPLNCRRLLPRKAKKKLRGRSCLLTEAGIVALDGSGSELIWEKAVP